MFSHSIFSQYKMFVCFSSSLSSRFIRKRSYLNVSVISIALKFQFHNVYALCFHFITLWLLFRTRMIIIVKTTNFYFNGYLERAYGERKQPNKICQKQLIVLCVARAESRTIHEINMGRKWRRSCKPKHCDGFIHCNTKILSTLIKRIKWVKCIFVRVRACVQCSLFFLSSSSGWLTLASAESSCR